MSLVSYADLVAPSPADPTVSTAEMSIQRMQDPAAPMPPAPAARATAADVQVLQAWIDAGEPSTCDAGTAGGAGSAGMAGSGGVVENPYATPLTCTSNQHWTGGNEESPNMHPGGACINCHSRGFEVAVTPRAGARWSRASARMVESLTLDAGDLLVTVKRHDARHRLIVELPDGELEDVGTVFRVSVTDGMTREVDVSEGVVVLRLRGKPELRLAAGESYRATGSVPVASSGPVGASANTVSSGPEGVAQADSQPAPRASRASVNKSEDARVCPEASLFEDGVQAFTPGDYPTAASALGRFSRACAGSGHSEDAAYLRMVALARAGRVDEARAAAHAYLNHFPNGFRNREAERLAGSK